MNKTILSIGILAGIQFASIVAISSSVGKICNDVANFKDDIFDRVEDAFDFGGISRFTGAKNFERLTDHLADRREKKRFYSNENIYTESEQEADDNTKKFDFFSGITKQRKKSKYQKYKNDTKRFRDANENFGKKAADIIKDAANKQKEGK